MIPVLQDHPGLTAVSMMARSELSEKLALSEHCCWRGMTSTFRSWPPPPSRKCSTSWWRRCFGRNRKVSESRKAASGIWRNPITVLHYSMCKLVMSLMEGTQALHLLHLLCCWNEVRGMRECPGHVPITDGQVKTVFFPQALNLLSKTSTLSQLEVQILGLKIL